MRILLVFSITSHTFAGRDWKDFEELLVKDGALGELRKLHKIKYDKFLSFILNNNLFTGEQRTLTAMATKPRTSGQLSSSSVGPSPTPSP